MASTAPKVSDSFGEEFVGGVLQELLQEELCRGCQKGVLTVGSTDATCRGRIFSMLSDTWN